MRVTIELYGVLQELAGAEFLQLEIAGTTVGDALKELSQQKPAMAPQLARTACAIGTDLVQPGDSLQDSSVLALIPPVSGG